MAFRTDYVQATGGDHLIMSLLPVSLYFLHFALARIIEFGDLGFPFAAKHNIGATASHVGSDRYDAGPTGLGNYLCFLLMEFRIQYFMLDFILG